MAAIRQISNKPIRIVVNTHSHFDHNQNNEPMAKEGALVFAHPNTRLALMQQKRPPLGLPAVTSAGPITFHFSGISAITQKSPSIYCHKCLQV